MRKFYVYLAKNTANRKGYVGKTYDLEGRWAWHKWQAIAGNQKPLYRAIRKYGIEKFKFITLSTHMTEAASFENEKRMIKKLDTFGKNGYNLTEGGEGVSGHTWTVEQIEHQRSMQRGRKKPRTKEHQEALNASIRNGPGMSEEGRLSLLESHKIKKEFIIMMNTEIDLAFPDRMAPLKRGQEGWVKPLKTRAHREKLREGAIIRNEFRRAMYRELSSKFVPYIELTEKNLRAFERKLLRNILKLPRRNIPRIKGLKRTEEQKVGMKAASARYWSKQSSHRKAKLARKKHPPIQQSTRDMMSESQTIRREFYRAMNLALDQIVPHPSVIEPFRGEPQVNRNSLRI